METNFVDLQEATSLLQIVGAINDIELPIKFDAWLEHNSQPDEPRLIKFCRFAIDSAIKVLSSQGLPTYQLCEIKIEPVTDGNKQYRGKVRLLHSSPEPLKRMLNKKPSRLCSWLAEKLEENVC